MYSQEAMATYIFWPWVGSSCCKVSVFLLVGNDTRRLDVLLAVVSAGDAGAGGLRDVAGEPAVLAGEPAVLVGEPAVLVGESTVLSRLVGGSRADLDDCVDAGGGDVGGPAKEK